MGCVGVALQTVDDPLGVVDPTRLAFEVAATIAGAGSDGCHIVELARLRDPSSVPAAVAAGLGLTMTGATPREALDHAGRLDLLLVLDNAEHVLEAVADVVERLIAAGGPLRVLVTSRERLGVDGEQLWPVAPLATEGAAAPARRLFVERARATLPHVPLREDDPHVARIVERLDGLPLALEMAAAQLHTIGLEDLADVLDERLTVLRSPRRSGHERHRDIRSLLEWSESRLTARQAATLAALAVFAGPVTAADINAVLGRPDAADDVRELAERSLVTVDITSTPTRFSLLHVVRMHAAERLRDAGRADELAERHARWFLSVARDADAQLRTPDEERGAQRIESVFGELRAAQWWARSHDVDLAAALCAHLHLYAHSRLVDEPLQWAEQLCATRDGDDPWLPVLLASAATRAINRGELAAARVLAARGVEVARDDRRALPAYEALGDACLYSGQVDESRAAHGALAQLGERLGDVHYGSMGAISLALIDGYAGDVASDAVIDAIEPPRERLSPTVQGWFAFARGELLHDADPNAAFAHPDRAVERARHSGSRFLEGVALISSCSLRARVGDIDVAYRSFRDTIRHWDRLADLTHQRTTLRNLVVLFQRADEPEATAELLGSVHHDDLAVFAREGQRLDAAHAWAVARLGTERFDERFARGRARDLAEAAAWALDTIRERLAAE